MILELEAGYFVNDYGYKETYVRKQITTYLSGHIYRGSAYESDDDCGTCDGVRCDQCREHYVVTICDRPKMHPDGYQVEDVKVKRTFLDNQEALDFYNAF